MKRSGDTVRFTTQTYYSNLTQNHGKASECLNFAGFAAALE